MATQIVERSGTSKSSVKGGLGVSAGHFNVFEIEPFVHEPKGPLPYDKRDFYKITVLEGTSRMLYADREVEIGKQALIFSNPFEPYCWEHFKSVHKGHYAIFNDAFFPEYGSLSRYPVFQPQQDHVFELSDEQLAQVKAVFQRMHAEIRSNYAFKFDLLRSLSQELMHFAMKLHPLAHERKAPNAGERISRLFIELLGRQFPIDELHPRMELRTASDFANAMSVHTNHLNRTLKDTLGHTTTELIAERVLREAKVLLGRTNWPVSEIGYALGFPEPTHFSNFFRKHTGQSPMRFRAV